MKIDLASMAKNNIILDDVTNKKLKANKKKRVVQKNVFTLGFDPGFTRFVLKSYNTIVRSTYPVMLVETKTKTKKSPIKKKIDIKAQKLAHKKKKKSKKSVWD